PQSGLYLGRTRRIDASPGDLTGQPDRLLSTLRAMGGHSKVAQLGLAPGPFFFYDLDDLRNDLTALLDENIVADFHSETFDLVFVMQRGARDCRAGQQNGLELGDWSQGPYSSHLNGDVAQQGCGLAGGELVGNRPSRRLGSSTQFLLKGGAVHFYDDTVDLVGQLIALAFPFGARLYYLIYRSA